MAADVGYLVRALSNIKGDRTMGLVTRDLLSESFSSSSSEIDHSQELHLDLQVTAGSEKRLDLKSGKVALQKCTTKLSTTKRPLKIMEDTNLDLKLETKNNSCGYKSVCTLDKVRFALDRAKNNEQMMKMFSPIGLSKSPSTSSTSTKVASGFDHEEVKEDERTINYKSQTEGLLTAAGCPNCLMYVMISKKNPKCPKCNLAVSLLVMKKPRIDLDLNILI